MTGVVWAVVAGVGFGVFQAFNRRAGRSIDSYLSTFLLLLVSAILLAIVSLLTEDLGLLREAPLMAYVHFGLAGFVHFFLGWTFLTLSQQRVGAARTGALIGTTPLFAFAVGLLFFGEVLSLPVVVGVLLVMAGVYLVSRGGPKAQAPSGSRDAETLDVTWRNSLFGLGTAICFALSAIFIRHGLEGLPSPLLGVTSGMIITTAAYGVLLVLRRKRVRQGPISRDAWLFQVAAGAFVGLATWVRWIALDMAPVAVVLALGRTNVPVVIFLAPLLVGRQAERVTGRVWLGAGLIVAGAVVLNLYA